MRRRHILRGALSTCGERGVGVSQELVVLGGESDDVFLLGRRRAHFLVLAMKVFVVVRLCLDVI